MMTKTYFIDQDINNDNVKKIKKQREKVKCLQNHYFCA